MTHLFVDTDIILDMLTGRQPFLKEASILFTLFEKERLKGYTTSLAFSNLYYVLRKYASRQKVISTLTELSELIGILNVDDSIIRGALSSKFKDFEDAIQCTTARDHPLIDVIITRNIKDFKSSALPVMTPETFLKTHQHTHKD